MSSNEQGQGALADVNIENNGSSTEGIVETMDGSKAGAPVNTTAAKPPNVNTNANTGNNTNNNR